MTNHQHLVKEIDEPCQRLCERNSLLEKAIEYMSDGLFLIDRNGHIIVHNRRVRDLLELPERFLATQPHVDAVYALQCEAGEFSRTDPSLLGEIAANALTPDANRYIRERPNGVVLEVLTAPTPSGGFVRTFRDISDQYRASERVAHLAHHDSLTGLPNRLLFRKRLEQAIQATQRNRGSFSLLLIDFDRFKMINDTLGHSAGDQLISVVSERLAALLSVGDTLARLGGDEFAIIHVCESVPEERAAALAEQIRESVARSVLIGDRQASTTASIGIALNSADSGGPEAILKNADLALYRAKADGRNRHRFFDESMARDVRERHELENDLRQAIRAEQLQVYYQPIVSTSTRRIRGFEALARWHHPIRGPVSPAQFIPIAEETGIIDKIGEWVLRKACLNAASWPEGMRLSVNLSPVQLNRRDLPDLIGSILSESGFAPQRLDLEITESVLLQNEERSLDVLHAIKAMGIGIALDDFGTGFSSLSHVRAFPLSKIKIDKSFVQELEEKIESSAIVAAIVGMGRMLDMTIVAEGVETERQFELLRAAGCGEVQGYLLGRPLPASQLCFDVKQATGS